MSHEQPPGDYPYQPYGAPYGQQPPPQYGYGHPPPPRHSGPNANAIVSLVLNLIAIVSCCNLLAIPGAILAGLSLRASTEPDTARTMVVWSWVLFGLGFLLTVGMFLFLGVNGYLDD
jgi:cytochrome c biogenesis protein CcdA